MTLLLKGARLVDPAAGIDGRRDLRIDDGRVTAIGADLPAGGAAVADLRGLVVTPGLIDIHVHLREPGKEDAEDIESGTRAAAAGGFTAVACMANTDPVNDTLSVTELIRRRAAALGAARVYPIGAVSVGLRGERLTEFGDLHRGGAVAVSDDGLPVRNAQLMRRALEYAGLFDFPVIQHAEDLDLSGDGVMHEGYYSTLLGLPGIPAASEQTVVARDLDLAALTRGRYHVAHLSSAGTLELVRRAKDRGIAVSAEVTPHHLLLTDAAVRSYDPNTKMRPPLRGAADVAALAAGVADGSLDCIASDHAPHRIEDKRCEYDRAAFGIVGLETAVALMLDRMVAPGHIRLARLVELMSLAPARLLKLEGGTLQPGSPADLTVLDLELRRPVDPNRFYSKAKNTPFGGWELQGWPVLTMMAGRVTHRDHERLPFWPESSPAP
ncbi:MAG TPA: dihydroorotase [Acidobacteriota bacterium]